MNSIAFLCISADGYAYTKEAICRIAVDVVAGWLSAHEFLRQGVFCSFRSN